MGNTRILTFVIHGESGAGKSYLADTAPGPRLILDVEGGTRFTPSKKVYWDPKEAVPEVGPDDSVVVTVTELDTIQRAFQWLVRGQHPFRSVVIDSLSEAQKRAVDSIAGTESMKMQDYGTLLRKIEAIVRAFRDLTVNPTKPVEVMVFVTGTREKGTDMHAVMRPALVGQMAEQLGYFTDVMGFLTVGVGTDGGLERKIQFAQLNGVAAKDRTGRLGINMENPTIPRMLEMIYGPS